MRKTREQMRNERAELVCRELRYQLGGKHADQDLSRALDLLIDWMRYAKKNKYTRPKAPKPHPLNNESENRS